MISAENLGHGFGGSPCCRVPHHFELLDARSRFLEQAQLAIESGTNLDTLQWLRSLAIAPDHATNVAGLIVETEITVLPGGLFSFSNFGFAAVVMMVQDRDAETPIDFVAWARDKQRRIYRYF